METTITEPITVEPEALNPEAEPPQTPESLPEGIFTKVLAGLDPENIHVVVPGGVVLARDGVGPEANGPSNKAIIQACNDQYCMHQKVVDSFTVAGNSYVQVPHGRANTSILDAFPWRNKELTTTIQNTGMVVMNDGIFGGALQQAMDQNQKGLLLTTFGVGAEITAQLIVGGQGGAGVVFDSLKRSPAKGFIWGAGTLGLSVGFSVDLALLLSGRLPEDLGDNFYGLTVFVSFGVGVTLSILVTRDLKQIIAFNIGVGVGFDLGAAVMAGGITHFG